MKLLHSGLYVYNLDPVERYDRGRQYELQVDVGQLADDSGPFQIKTIVAPFQRLSSKQSLRDLLSAGLNNHAAHNSLPLSQWSESRRNPLDEWAYISNLLNIDFAYPEWDHLYNTTKYSNHECTT